MDISSLHVFYQYIFSYYIFFILNQYIFYKILIIQLTIVIIY